jgi:hypothetical protein
MWAKRRVKASLLTAPIEALDELEHRDPRFGLRLEPAPVEKLAFQCGEEALAHGIVVGVSDRAHRRTNPRRRHSSIGYLSPIDYERRYAANPDAHQPAAVLAAVKDKLSGRPPSGAVLDRRCARRPHHRAGRDGRMAPPGPNKRKAPNRRAKCPQTRYPDAKSSTLHETGAGPP